jgi:hypothetical protein
MYTVYAYVCMVLVLANPKYIRGLCIATRAISHRLLRLTVRTVRRCFILK